MEAKLKDTLGVEDDVVEEMVMGLLQEGGKQGPDPKVMQVSLSGFLEKNAKRFMRDLWKYLKDVAEGKTAAAAAVRRCQALEPWRSLAVCVSAAEAARQGRQDFGIAGHIRSV